MATVDLSLSDSDTSDVSPIPPPAASSSTQVLCSDDASDSSSPVSETSANAGKSHAVSTEPWATDDFFSAASPNQEPSVDEAADVNPKAASLSSGTTPPCPGCGESCAVRAVTKSGKNKGRHFYVCPRTGGDLQCEGWVGWVPDGSETVASGGGKSKVGMSFAEIQQRERDEARRGEATAKGRNDGDLARGSFVQFSKKSRVGYKAFEGGRQTNVFSASVSSIAKEKTGSSSGVKKMKRTSKTTATGESKKATSISKTKPPSLSFSSSSTSTSSAAPSKVLSAAELREARLLALSGK